MNIELTAALLGFLAAIAAIRGETWDASRRGIRKLTLPGIAALLIALSALVVSGLNQHQLAQGKQARLNFAASQVSDCCWELLLSFERLESYVLINAERAKQDIASESEAIRSVGERLERLIARYKNDLNPRFISLAERAISSRAVSNTPETVLKVFAEPISREHWFETSSEAVRALAKYVCDISGTRGSCMPLYHDDLL